GVSCKCGSKKGVYWFGQITGCPGGHGYKGSCSYVLG
nr:RecName: Full=Toxin Bcg III 29.21; Short=Toxin Bcg 29.21 [Bunodosoma cangicum]